jgi:CubicO group peptidase (beta-lactamase class C family)
MQPGEQHALQSCTKVITSTLIAQLINEKKIDIELPVETYLPELKQTDWSGTAVKHILHMRSGMIGSENSESMGGFTNPKHPYYFN